MVELMKRVAGAIWPDPQNSRCVVGESVTRNPRCWVAIRLCKGELLSKRLKRRSKSRLLTLRNQCLGDLVTALGMTHESEGNRNALAGQKSVTLPTRDGPHRS